MDEEMENEGMEDDISSGKGKSKGGKLKMMIIGGVLFVVAVVVVFGFILPMLGPPPEGEAESEEKQKEKIDMTKYGIEFMVETVTVSMPKKQRNRVQNFIVDVVLETTKKGAVELGKRMAQIQNIIQREIQSRDVDQVILLKTQEDISDSIMIKVNKRLPLDEEDKVKSVVLKIITQ